MSHFVLFILALLASLTFASPVPVVDGELVNIEKRITHTGRGTWYYPGEGNCGYTDNSEDLVLAIGKGLYDANGGSNCDQWVSIVSNGNTAYGLTRDSCESCSNNDIDMSPALFQQLAPLSTGEITVSWHFMDKSWSP